MAEENVVFEVRLSAHGIATKTHEKKTEDWPSVYTHFCHFLCLFVFFVATAAEPNTSDSQAEVVDRESWLRFLMQQPVQL